MVLRRVFRWGGAWGGGPAKIVRGGGARGEEHGAARVLWGGGVRVVGGQYGYCGSGRGGGQYESSVRTRGGGECTTLATCWAHFHGYILPRTAMATAPYCHDSYHYHGYYCLVLAFSWPLPRPVIVMAITALSCHCHGYYCLVLSFNWPLPHPVIVTATASSWFLVVFPHLPPVSLPLRYSFCSHSH